jgi:hypothetical protein
MVAELRDQVARLTDAFEAAQARAAAAESSIPPSYRRELIPVGKNALMVWRPRRR